MQGWEYNNLVSGGGQPGGGAPPLSAALQPTPQRQQQLTFGIYSTTPPATEPECILQRADEVNAVRRMLSNPNTSAVFLTGEPGVGKSTLAALVYKSIQTLAQVAKEPPLRPRYFVWLSISSFANLPDVIAAILRSINVDTSTFFLLKPEQQIAALVRALRRPQESAFIVLDQFEQLLDPETAQGLVGRGALAAFFEMLQMDLGTSRLLLTSYLSPYGPLNDDEKRVRSYLVSRVSIPEGVSLLLQRGLQGSYEDLSLVWQRCGGHVFALLLVCALVQLSGISLPYLLHAAEYQPLWSGDVTLQTIAALYRQLSPVQTLLLRALALFSEPVPLAGIVTTVTGQYASAHALRFEQELLQLVQLSLVQRSLNEAGVTCYDLHSLLRQYVLAAYLEGNDLHHSEALEKMLGLRSPLLEALAGLKPDAPEAREIALANSHLQVAAYYRRLALEQCPPREQRTGLQDVVPLLHAIRHLCLGWRWQEACDLLFGESLHESLMRWGTWNTLMSMYTGMLPPSGLLTRHDEGLVNSHLGLLYARLGEYEQSRLCYEQALGIQQALGDQHDAAVTLVNMGELYRSMGALQQAQTYFEQALLLNRQLAEPDPEIECVVLHNLGLLCQTQKQYQQALSYYQQSLKLALRTQERYDIGMIVTNMGMLLYEQGRQVEGLALLFFAVQWRQALQDPTVSTVELFLSTLEQRLGAEAFAGLRQAALLQQEQLVSQLFA
ncbi:tetratricopeptide repeat protein [Thermogemmatispora onikobensis]|uniref:tetratricopeptide repeat protein n=1 Tax=Thermogemmatispora onikobensis TaxID=732234 RepID=UPI000853CE28|nr:tetratricopeptide repeat protein [Thermogemmatispora onikobensis]